VFENGHVAETGTFDELVGMGGRFAALAKAQFMTTEAKAEKSWEI
jgi:ATP-binding cassette subfamily B protein